MFQLKCFRCENAQHETNIKQRRWNVSELFQSCFTFYSHVKKYANEEFVLANHGAVEATGAKKKGEGEMWRHCDIIQCFSIIMEPKRKCCDADISFLIDCWHLEPALWNSTKAEYSNADARKAALQRISEKTSLDTGQYVF